jgi:ribosome recycling factor
MPTHLDAHKAEFQAAIDHFHKELQGLRTGRASASVVEDIRVEAYDGQTMDLKSVASITTPDAKTIQIEPWDKSIVKNIEKALVDASLGMMPNTAGTVIRMILPPMTEEGRKNLVKILHQKEEVARVGIRGIRDKVKTAVTNDEKNKLMSEDDKRRQLEQLDKVVAEWNGKIEKITEEKETEILTV